MRYHPTMVEGVVELRKKNQVTLPSEVAREMGVREGARLIITYNPEAGEARVRPLRDSYSGTLRGVYGRTPAVIREYLKGERESWD